MIGGSDIHYHVVVDFTGSTTGVDRIEGISEIAELLANIDRFQMNIKAISVRVTNRRSEVMFR